MAHLHLCAWEERLKGWVGAEQASEEALGQLWKPRQKGRDLLWDRPMGGSAPETLTSSLGECVGGRPRVLYVRLAGRPSALSSGRGTGLRHSVQRTSNTVPYSRNRENTFFN